MVDAKPPPPLPSPSQGHLSNSNPFDFSTPVAPTSGTVDLDGMTVMSDLNHTNTDPTLDLGLNLNPVEELPEAEEGNLLDAPDSPSTAAFAPFITEIFGPNWRCPSPVILHIDNPTDTPPTATSGPNNALCPIWKKSNELFGKVFSYRPGTTDALLNIDAVEAGLLYLGIRNGWTSFNEWMQSPALKILKSVDEFLFVHLPRMERLAVAYKSFKLLKVSALHSLLMENVLTWLIVLS